MIKKESRKAYQNNKIYGTRRNLGKKVYMIKLKFISKKIY